MHYTIRPLTLWTDPPVERQQSSGTFSASWDSTLMLLAFEIGQLDGETFVIELDVDENDIAISSALKSGRKPRTDRVRISFESRHGPLRYSTEAFTNTWRNDMDGWRANVRAIALGLEALRKLDRYGIGSRAEQYVGYKAIGAGTTALGRDALEPDVARRIISDESGFGIDTLNDPNVLRTAIKRAKAQSHPDNKNGDRSAWDAVDRAAKSLQIDENVS